MEDAGTDALQESLERYRALRREIEANLLQVATSIDGRRFTFQAPISTTSLLPGLYVALELEGETRVGQVTRAELTSVDAAMLTASLGDLGSGQAAVRVRSIAGEGVVLGGAATPFAEAALRPLTASEASAWIDEQPISRVVVGSLELDGSSVPFPLDARGFARHTFMCGQSGSGKTYALGVVLERLLLETSLPVLVLDPNSDFVKLHTPRSDADPAFVARWTDMAAGIAVRRVRDDGAQRLRLGFPELGEASRAAALGLDPIEDRDEWFQLSTETAASPRDLVDRTMEMSGASQQLALRIRNLGVDRWEIWRGDDEHGSLLEEIDARAHRCLVADLGTLASSHERALVAEAVLDRLWESRHARRPILLVIDEAHNVCPTSTDDPLLRRATQQAIRIAAEGRKYGIYLFLATQRPWNVHEGVVSQCDNLLLLRMNSTTDVGRLGEIFSFVPTSLLERAAGFRLGEALAAGRIAPNPGVLRIDRRLTEEGGGDVPSDWAAP
jgi:DNA helicase HerA-like ATPase